MKVLSLLTFLILFCTQGFAQNAEDFFKQADEITGLTKEELKQKISLLTKAINLQNSYEDAILLRAKTYQEQNAYKEALADYSTLIAMDTSKALWYKFRAKIFAAKGDAEKAISDYSKAYDIDTLFIDCIYERGNIYNNFYLGKQSEKALADFDLCIAKGSINIKSKAYVGRGRVLENSEQFEKAFKEYNTAIKVNPLNSEAYLYRGILKIALNQDGCYDLLKYREMNGENAQDYLNKYCTK